MFFDPSRIFLLFHLVCFFNRISLQRNITLMISFWIDLYGFPWFPSFCPSCNKSPELTGLLHWERDSSHGRVPKRMGEHFLIFLKQKNSWPSLEFEPRPPAWQASALSITLCTSGWEPNLILLTLDKTMSTLDVFISSDVTFQFPQWTNEPTS